MIPLAKIVPNNMSRLFHHIRDESRSPERRYTISDEILQRLLGTTEALLPQHATNLQKTWVTRLDSTEREAQLLHDAQIQVQELLMLEIKRVSEKVDLRHWHELHNDPATRYLLTLIAAYAQRLQALVLVSGEGSLNSDTGSGVWHDSHHHIIESSVRGITFDFRMCGTGFTERSIKTILWENLSSIQSFEFYLPDPPKEFPPQWFTPSETRQRLEDLDALANFMGELNDICLEQNLDVIESAVKTFLRQIEHDAPSSWTRTPRSSQLQPAFDRLKPDDWREKLDFVINQVQSSEYPNMSRKIQRRAFLNMLWSLREKDVGGMRRHLSNVQNPELYLKTLNVSDPRDVQKGVEDADLALAFLYFTTEGNDM